MFSLGSKIIDLGWP